VQSNPTSIHSTNARNVNLDSVNLCSAVPFLTMLRLVHAGLLADGAVEGTARAWKS